MSPMKTCRDCRERKYKDDFYHHPDTHDGLMSSCKVCRRRYAVQYRIDNAEACAEYHRARRAKVSA